MKNLIIIASLLLSLPIMAQTKVVKKNAVKANNFGITYSLPKTSLVVDAEVTKVTCKAGPYYKYAEKYLGVKDAITEDKVYYELGKISLVNKGVPDADNTFIVEFKAGTVAPYAYLTEDGLLCSAIRNGTRRQHNTTLPDCLGSCNGHHLSKRFQCRFNESSSVGSIYV